MIYEKMNIIHYNLPPFWACMHAHTTFPVKNAYHQNGKENKRLQVYYQIFFDEDSKNKKVSEIFLNFLRWTCFWLQSF